MEKIKLFFINVFAALVFIILLLIIVNSWSNCLTKECLTASKTILKKMNLSVDPCVDFVKFSCGSSIQTDLKTTLSNRIMRKLVYALLEPVDSKEPQFIENLKNLYVTCNNDKLDQFYCLKMVRKHMSLALNRLYVDHYFDKNLKLEVLDLISNIKKAFKDIINNSNWLSKLTKNNIQQSIDKIKQVVGYEDFLLNNTLLNEIYKEYNFDSKNYTSNLIKLNNLKERSNSNRLSKIETLDTNAHYSHKYHEIVLSFGVLQKGLFGTNYPKYLNYGALGTIIGHEMMHAFDLDSFNKSIWENQDKKDYLRKLECFKRKNLSTDLNELIADSVGIQVAFNAYQKWVLNNKPEKPLTRLHFSTNQLFFISYSQIWCSRNKERLNVPLLNFKKFSEAFKCTNQHLFNKRCVLF